MLILLNSRWPLFQTIDLPPSVHLDYAGQFVIRTYKGRGYASTKNYVSIFVCMVTWAVDVDLTTAPFLATYRRFASRRGNCSITYSHNATNFRGAAIELNELLCTTSNFSKELRKSLAREDTSWSFIQQEHHLLVVYRKPMRKVFTRFKHHLKLIIGHSTLTFDNFGMFHPHNLP